MASTDDTGELLDAHFSDDPRVRIIHQVNRGKAAALNRAISEAETEIVVTIDADTEIEPDAIRKLARHFSDPKLAANRGQRESRQPFALADALAGAGIHHQPEHGKARVRFAELHHGRSRRAGRVAQIRN